MNKSLKLELSRIREASHAYGRLFPKFSLRRVLVTYRYKICPFDAIIPYINGKSLFDIGCGSGFLLYIANKLCGISKLNGVDVKKKTVETTNNILQKHTQANSVSIYHTNDVSAWQADVFDTVTMIDVLHHIPPKDQKQFVLYAMQKVSPDGYFIYKDMSNKPFIYGLMNRLHDLILARQWIHYIDINEIKELFLINNFDVIKVNRKILFWYAHEMIVFRRK
jgi:2-polyprenyl-3-methyl-5-hydroxy-6-metoxy-1,4-benzoquinol methylase